MTHYDRALREMLGAVEVFIDGDGPNGPWVWGFLTITREGNTIIVRDGDGKLMRAIDNSELPNYNSEAMQELKWTFDRLDKKARGEL